MNVVLGPRCERIPGPVRRMSPTFEELADRVASMQDLCLSRYWPHLAAQLADAVEAIHRTHAGHCRRRCPTCVAVRQAVAVVDADRLVQGGCTCPPADGPQLALAGDDGPLCGCPPRVGIPCASYRGTGR